jgi:hypothetical protein
MYTYTLLTNGFIQRSDGAVIPVDPLNTDYAAYLAWVSAGNTPTPVPGPTLQQAQAAQAALISDACANAIFAGFSSNALGTAHTYPAKATDQQNLASSVLASLMPNLPSTWTTPFWCADSSGNWSWATHTAAQIQQVGQDGKAAILTCMSKNQQLQDQIAAATTVSAVQQITW